MPYFRYTNISKQTSILGKRGYVFLSNSYLFGTEVGVLQCHLTESPDTAAGAGVWDSEPRLRSQPWHLLGVLLVTSLSEPQFIGELGTAAPPPLRTVIRSAVREGPAPCLSNRYLENIIPSFPFPISFKLISSWFQRSALQSHFDFLFLPGPRTTQGPRVLGSLHRSARPTLQPASCLFTPSRT